MKKRVTFTFDEELINYLKEVSEKTMIPQSRLAEQAIKEYLDKIKATKN
jgi:predicted transcriptional regulator